ncbi:MAG: hypothetical protein D6704_06345, partial [Nitrospirae bacterium]
LLHDEPLRDLSDRPLVDQTIIPVALRQPGVGVYGTIYPTQLSKLDYELYVTNGFKDDIQGQKGLKDARFPKTDNNDGKSIVGRIAFSPILGIEIGGSGFFGAYDDKSKRPLAIWALDWTILRGPFELIGEAAWSYARDNHLNDCGSTKGPFVACPRRMFGYYIQGNFHFLPPILTRLAPTFFRPEISTFTAVLRWEQLDLNKDFDGNTISKGNGAEKERLTVGLNFRPTEDTVFKLDFQYSPKAIGSFAGVTAPVHDTAFVASWATYF